MKRGRWAVLATVVVVTTTVAAIAVTRDDSGEATSDATPPRLQALGVAPDLFRSRWNAAVGALGTGVELTDPGWAPDDELGLEVASQPLAEWGLLDLYRSPDGDLAGLHLVARPTAAAVDGFRATVVAAVAAALDLPADEARQLLDADLTASVAEASTVERGGQRLVLTRPDDATWDLRIVRADVPPG